MGPSCGTHPSTTPVNIRQIGPLFMTSRVALLLTHKGQRAQLIFAMELSGRHPVVAGLSIAKYWSVRCPI